MLPITLKTQQHLTAPTPTPLQTSFPPLDAALHGGLPRPSLVEIHGPPASGKTSLTLSIIAHTLCTHPEATAILLDVDASQPAHRLLQLLSAQLPDRAAVAHALARLHVQRIPSWDALVAAVHLLPSRAASLRTVAVVAVDSLAAAFRTCAAVGAAKRLEALAQRLYAVGVSCGAAVLLVNHARVAPAGVLPAMGEQWMHVCSTSIAVRFSGRARIVEVVKSPVAARWSRRFEVTEGGLVDAEQV